MAAELIEQGADPDDVAAFVEASLEDDDEEDDDQDEPGDVECWEENADAFAVFQRCHWQRQLVAGMDKMVMVHEGIESSEIQSVCDMMNIDRDRQPEVLSAVRIMVHAALPLLNER